MGKGVSPGDDDARDPLIAKLGEALQSDLLAEFLEVGVLRITENLDSFLGEVGKEASKSESGSIKSSPCRSRNS